MRLQPFSVRLSTPLSTARGTVSRRRGFLIALGDDVRGVGEATPLAGWTEPYDRCRAELRGFATAVDRLESPGLPASPAARHGVALARLDRDARVAGLPLVDHLSNRHGVGAGAADSVPVNATVGDASPEETARRSRDAVEDGFDCLKVKVGSRPLEADLARLRAVREAVGEEVTLRADANGAWEPAVAERALPELADVGVSYLEQPLPPGNLEAHARLRGRDVGVALDESLAAGELGASPTDRLRAVLEAEAADVVVLKPMALGGPDRAAAAAAAAREAGVEPAVTTTIDAVVARTAAVHVAATIPDVIACGLATGSLLSADLAPDPAPVVDGRIRLPDRPGVGVDLADAL
ncbi:MAG: o-succinylbenzoate synthase [Haloferacaceae archaeon]